MNGELQSPLGQIRQARESLYDEWVRLQIVGRALMSEERQRNETLGRAIDILD